MSSEPGAGLRAELEQFTGAVAPEAEPAARVAFIALKAALIRFTSWYTQLPGCVRAEPNTVTR